MERDDNIVRLEKMIVTEFGSMTKAREAKKRGDPHAKKMLNILKKLRS